MTMTTTSLLLLSTLAGSMLISVSSNSWLTAWMGLEVNLMSFVPLMSSTKNMMNTESSLKYFMVQVLASMTMMFMAIMKILTNDLFTFTDNHMPLMVMQTALLMKTGAAPLHWWFPGVMEGLKWESCTLLLTVQKIAPLMLLSYLVKSGSFTMTIALLSATTGAVGGLNQTSLRKIMTYSSIGHTGWMLLAMTMGKSMWAGYFTVYSALVISITAMLNALKISFINQTLMASSMAPTAKTMMFSSMLSLGGLPPFLGFIPKWMILQTMITSNQIPAAIYLTMMSTITLYYYLKMCYSSMMTWSAEPKWNHQTQSPKTMKLNIAMLTAAAITGMTMCLIITSGT